MAEKKGVCVGVLQGGGMERGGARGQASELTDLGDYIKTTHLSIIGRREEASKRRRVFEREYLHGLASCCRRALHDDDDVVVNWFQSRKSAF